MGLRVRVMLNASNKSIVTPTFHFPSAARIFEIKPSSWSTRRLQTNPAWFGRPLSELWKISHPQTLCILGSAALLQFLLCKFLIGVFYERGCHLVDELLPYLTESGNLLKAEYSEHIQKDFPEHLMHFVCRRHLFGAYGQICMNIIRSPPAATHILGGCPFVPTIHKHQKSCARIMDAFTLITGLDCKIWRPSKVSLMMSTGLLLVLISVISWKIPNQMSG